MTDIEKAASALVQAELDMQFAYNKLTNAQDRASELAKKTDYARTAYFRSKSKVRLEHFEKCRAEWDAALEECERRYAGYDLACGAVHRAEIAFDGARARYASPLLPL